MKPALIIGLEQCHGTFFLRYDKLSMGERPRIWNTLSRRPAMNGSCRNNPFETRFWLRLRWGRCLSQDDPRK